MNDYDFFASVSDFYNEKRENDTMLPVGKDARRVNPQAATTTSMKTMMAITATATALLAILSSINLVGAQETGVSSKVKVLAVRTNNGGELLTEASDFESRCTNIKMVNFNQFQSDDGFMSTAGPVQVGTTSVPSSVGESIVYTASSNSSVIGAGDFMIHGSGSWESEVDGRGGFVGVNPVGEYIDLTFQDELKCCVGGFVNYAASVAAANAANAATATTTHPLPLPLMQVLDSSGNVLTTFDYINDGAAINTPPAGVNEGAFRGIFRKACDICTLRISNSFQLLDDLTFSAESAGTVAHQLQSEL